MAASVRIDDEAFSDERFGVLATLCQLADADHARGKMARLWRQCTALHSYVLPISVVCSVLGENGAVSLEKSGLGEPVEGGIRICGTRGRIEWLKKLRNNAKKGGTAKAAKRQPTGNPDGTAKASKTLPPPFPPTPVPDPTKKEEDLSGKPDGLTLGLQEPQTKTPVQILAETAVAEINRPSGKRYRADSDAILKLCAALERAKRTPEQVAAVIRHQRGWIGDPVMGKYFRPSTLLAAENFANYLDDIEAQGGRVEQAQDSTAQLRQATDRPEVVHPLMVMFTEDADAAP